MCNLKIQGMSRAGEPPLEKMMTQNKDLNSAAVRGEAVAECSVCNGTKCVFGAAFDPPSQCEACFVDGGEDAPASGSEPTDVLHQFRGRVLPGRGLSEWSGWVPCSKGAYDELALNPDFQVRAFGLLSARAADAPSEPSELVFAQRDGVPFRHLEYGDGLFFTLNAGKSRAADVLDSQPTVLAYVATDLDGRADVGMTREKAMERAGQSCDTIIPVYDLGNSQPTVAAQQGSISQKSIGDDVQFWPWLDRLGDCGNAEQFKQVSAAFVAYIDSRAPAAPVAPLAPDGWKLVPIKPTEQMCDEIWAQSYPETTRRYTRMLASAPVPQQEGSEAGK